MRVALYMNATPQIDFLILILIGTLAGRRKARKKILSVQWKL